MGTYPFNRQKSLENMSHQGTHPAMCQVTGIPLEQLTSLRELGVDVDKHDREKSSQGQSMLKFSEISLEN